MFEQRPDRSASPPPVEPHCQEDLARTTYSPTDRLQASLRRLESSGAFDDTQLKLIEQELHQLCQDEESFSHTSMPAPGDQVAGFVIDELLGCGGEAHVYRAHEAKTHKPTAIKVLHNARTSDRFHREMKMVQQLAHPNIVTAYEVDEINGMPFIAMELMPGPDLNALVIEQGPLGWQQASHYVMQIACALTHAHCRDLVHRDIKPGNIIMGSDNQVKLVDLGLAAMQEQQLEDETRTPHLTRETQIAGTLPYMAPEQAHSLARADVRSDIYSLGSTWFYLLTGKTMLRGRSFSRQYRNLVVKRRFRSLPDGCLPERLRDIFEQMIAYDRRERFPCCSNLKQSLSDAMIDLGEVVTSKQLNVLIVEDSQSDMFLAVELLRMANESVTIYEATSLAEGIKVCSEHPIDLVFLDLTLPDSAGVETVTTMRQHSQETPIVVLTGMSDEETSTACVQAGATEFLSKTDLTAHKLERLIFVTLSRHATA